CIQPRVFNAKPCAPSQSTSDLPNSLPHSYNMLVFASAPSRPHPGGALVSVPSTSEREQQSFAEAALRLSGKTDEEARRTGAVDKADEQVESLFAPQYQTANSPVHKAVWDRAVPLAGFQPPQPALALPCDAAMERSLAIVRRHREGGTLYDANGKVTVELLEELGAAGYWGMLIDPAFGGQGAPFARF